MCTTKTKLFSCIFILAGLLLCGPRANGQDTAFSYLNDRFGITVNAPEGFNVEATETITWKPNVNSKQKYSGSFFNVTAVSADGNCLILYPEFLNHMLVKGKEDRLDGHMALINREMMEGFGALDGTGMTTLYTSKVDDLFYAEDHLTKITGESVRSMTGADMVCFYDLPAETSEFKCTKSTALDNFKAKTLTRVHILKEGGSHFDVIMLMNESGEAFKWHYLQQVLSNIHFDGDRIQKSWEVIGE